MKLAVKNFKLVIHRIF